jgi:hypothetical protein
MTPYKSTGAAMVASTDIPMQVYRFQCNGSSPGIQKYLPGSCR